MLVTEPTRPMLRQLIAHADRHLTMKQATAGNLIIGGAWPADTDPATGYARVARSSIEGNLWVAERTVPLVGDGSLGRMFATVAVNVTGSPPTAAAVEATTETFVGSRLSSARSSSRSTVMARPAARLRRPVSIRAARAEPARRRT